MPVRPAPHSAALRALDVAAVAGSVARRLDVTHRVLREVVTLHLQTVVAAAEYDVPEVLAEQFRWERTRLGAAGVTLRPDDLHEAALAELALVLEPGVHERLRLLYAAAAGSEADPTSSTAPELSPAATRYLDAALANDAAGAVQVVRTALARGAGAPTVIREILQPAQVETGRRWESGDLSVAEEHRVTAITARCLALFEDPRTLPAAPTGPRPRLLASTVGEEGHDLGLRMLSEVMTDGGWDVEYLGAGVPADELVEHVARSRPDVLALSATLSAHVPLLAAVVDGVRHGAVPDLKVLVGGRAFASRPDLATTLGADGWARDADGALQQCRAWVGLPAVPEAVPAASDQAPGPGLDDLAERYRIDRHHVAGALDLLAAHSGLSREELAARLGTPGS